MPVNKSKVRQTSNVAILNELYELVEKNPHVRFGQLLEMMGICSSNEGGQTWKDEFYTESYDTLETVLKIKSQRKTMRGG